MHTSSLSFAQAFFEVPDFSCRPIENWAKDKAAFVKRVLDKHTDVILNLGILASSTCLLVAKIFEQTPKIFPLMANFAFNYLGIIWLNGQVRDFLKSGKDFLRATQKMKIGGLVETAAKVFVKGVNILLTCVIFAGSVISAFIFPQASLMIALSIRSFSLACLFVNIASDIRDYFANEALLRRLEKIEAEPDGSVLIGKVMVCFLEIVKNQKTPSKVSFPWKAEWILADTLVRQLDHYTLETFRESLAEERKEKKSLIDALKLFYGVKDGMRHNQGVTKSNLNQTVFFYLSMGICRAFPYTLVDLFTRWSCSVLYTDDFIQRKFFQSDLSGRIN